MQIEGIEINGQNIANAIMKYYPNSINPIINKQLIEYVIIFGIRVETCDTGIPDDFLGAIRLQTSFITGEIYWEFILTEGTTDPSPQNLKPKVINGVPQKWYFDEQARVKGGTAWVKEGAHIYYLNNPCNYGPWTIFNPEPPRKTVTKKNADCYHNYPSFKPGSIIKDEKTGKKVLTAGTVEVRRWNPAYVGEKFDERKAIESDSTDCLIHRSWNTERYTNDSAGCQVFKNNALLWDLRDWAKNHINIYGNNAFSYILLTKKQFVEANKNSPQMGYWGIGIW